MYKGLPQVHGNPSFQHMVHPLLQVHVDELQHLNVRFTRNIITLRRD